MCIRDSNNNDAKRTNNDVLLMNHQQLQSKLLYRHLTSGNTKIYSSGKSYLIPLSTYRNNENLMAKDGNYLESSPLQMVSPSPMSPSVQVYATMAGGVSNIICEKNNYTIQLSLIHILITGMKVNI